MGEEVRVRAGRRNERNDMNTTNPTDVVEEEHPRTLAGMMKAFEDSMKSHIAKSHDETGEDDEHCFEEEVNTNKENEKKSDEHEFNQKKKAAEVTFTLKVCLIVSFSSQTLI